MKINDPTFDPRFDFRITPPSDGKPSSGNTSGNGRPALDRTGHDDAGASANLPARIDRPAALVSGDGPAGADVRDNNDASRRDAADAESLARRAVAMKIIGRDVDVRAMTPREASDVGLQLYAEGLVTWDEYAEFAFQPELHPGYNETIGALLGKEAAPDQPRDFVQQWSERLAYEQRYNPIDSPRVKSSERIRAIVGRLAGEKVSLDV